MENQTDSIEVTSEENTIENESLETSQETDSEAYPETYSDTEVLAGVHTDTIENSNSEEQEGDEVAIAVASTELDGDDAENEEDDEDDNDLVLTSEQLDANEIQSCIEAILFISDKPLSLDKFRQMLGPHFELSLFEEALRALQERYQAVHHGIELLEIAGGYQLRTKVGRAGLAKKLVKVQSQRLSAGAMETLAIISYKQPVMKEEIDKIRGVDSSYFVRNLMEKKLIYISGRSELPGRPILYSTTQEFLEIFGLRDLSSLPPLRELEQMVPNSESDNPEDDDPRTRELRRVVGAMNKDKSTLLYYNPEEDEKILKEIREKVTAIATTTPYLNELKAAETLAKQQAKEQALAESAPPEMEPEVAPPPL
jgi:segregation and condensation protein B